MTEGSVGMFLEDLTVNRSVMGTASQVVGIRETIFLNR